MCSYAESNYKAPPSLVLAAAIQKHLEYLKGSLRWGSRCRVKQESLLSQCCLSGCGANQGQSYVLFFYNPGWREPFWRRELTVYKTKRTAAWLACPSPENLLLFLLNKDKCLYSEIIIQEFCGMHLLLWCFSLWSFCRGCSGTLVFQLFEGAQMLLFEEVVSVFCLILSSQRRFLHLICSWNVFVSILTTLTLPVTVFWGWTTYPSASYVACSAVHHAPARSPPSWPSCPQSPPTASCVMRVAADGRCTSQSAPTGSTHPARRMPSSVSWHAPREGTALPACLSAARPAPATLYYSPMETQWTWARWAASTLAWARASTATSSPMTTRVTGPVLGSPRRRTCMLM